MDKRSERLEVLRVLIVIFAPVGLIILIASRYPSMMSAESRQGQASKPFVRSRHSLNPLLK